MKNTVTAIGLPTDNRHADCGSAGRPVHIKAKGSKSPEIAMGAGRGGQDLAKGAVSWHYCMNIPQPQRQSVRTNDPVWHYRAPSCDKKGLFVKFCKSFSASGAGKTSIQGVKADCSCIRPMRRYATLATTNGIVSETCCLDVMALVGVTARDNRLFVEVCRCTAIGRACRGAICVEAVWRCTGSRRASALSADGGEVSDVWERVFLAVFLPRMLTTNTPR